MAAVMIGVDPHKGSHTAVVISGSEELLDTVRLRASASQPGQLIEWAAAAWPQRTWAVEGAAGLGHMLAQQLVAAGEQVVDVRLLCGRREYAAPGQPGARLPLAGCWSAPHIHRLSRKARSWSGGLAEEIFTVSLILTACSGKSVHR